MDILRKSKIIPFCMIIAVGVIYLTSFLSLPKVRITSDGKVIELRTSKTHTGEILRKAGVRIGHLDIVKMDFNGHLQSKAKDIKVIRVRESIIKKEQEVPFTVISRSVMKRNLRPVELLKGYEGIKEKIIRITYFDNREHKREVLEEREDKNVIFKLALKYKNGKTEKVYDLSKAKKMYVTATAYYPGDPMCKPYDGYTTAIGMKLKRGLVAVDPRVIPLRKRLYIPRYGYAYSADTGGMIKGKRIDVCVADAKAAYKFGRQRLLVYILD